MYDVIIIGGGPAGLTAAIYTSRSHLSTLVLEPQLEGGQMAQTLNVENYPGIVDGESGMAIGMRMKQQALSFGAEIKKERVEKLGVDGAEKIVSTSKDDYRAKYVIVATGCTPNQLGVPGESEFASRGVSYCATCDGAFYGNGEVYVIGGGNSAVQEALYLENLGAKVHIVHRRGEFRAEGFIAEAAKENENIEIHWHTELKEIKGDKMVEGLVLYNNETGETTVVEKGDKPLGIFIYVGQQPQTDILAPIVKLKNGFVPVDRNCMTEVDGIFAAGDIVNKKFRQIVTACGDGCTAAMEVAERIVQYH